MTAPPLSRLADIEAAVTAAGTALNMALDRVRQANEELDEAERAFEDAESVKRDAYIDDKNAKLAAARRLRAINEGAAS